MKPIDILGITGGVLALFAFYRTSIGKWTNKSLWYELDNFAGAVCLGLYAFNKGAYISIVLNFIWATVALVGVTSLTERRVERRVRSTVKKVNKRVKKANKQVKKALKI